MRFSPSTFLSILALAGCSSLALAVTPVPAISAAAITHIPSYSAPATPLFETAGNSSSADAALPDAPDADFTQAQTTTSATTSAPDANPKQTKRILFIIPNFRSVSADVKLPPLTPKDKFKLFLSDTFDYSSFIEVGLLAGSADWHKSEPEFGHGAVAYGRYYWHGLADNTDGNLMTEFIVPALAREDPRYYTLGHDGFVKRTGYSISRLLITRTDSGGRNFNYAEILGNGASASISNFYYPGNERDWTKTGQRWILQVGIDGVSNLVKEFWPDINAHIFHNKE